MATIADIVVDQANAAGIDPSIALAVARQESGLKQFNADGSVVKSSAGAIGVMQLLPSTAAGLGVDPYDTEDNIRGGCRYLAQLYSQFGSWSQALAAYNWGPGHVQKALAGNGSFPSGVLAYVAGILRPVGSSLGIQSSGTSVNASTIILGAGAVVGLVLLVRIIRG